MGTKPKNLLHKDMNSPPKNHYSAENASLDIMRVHCTYTRVAEIID